jgi:hypothetical protein
LVTQLADFLSLQILVESFMNHLSRNVMGLHEFLDTLPPVILHFGGNIGDGSLFIVVSLIHRHHQRFCLLRPLIAYMGILVKALLKPCQGLVMVGLLDNFLNPIKLFLAVMNNLLELLLRRFPGVRRE